MSYSLFLYPRISDNKPVLKSELLPYLIKHQLAVYSTRADVLEPGEQMMAYINYLGCSPSLKSGELDATIQVHQFKQLTAMGGQSVETIRYPGCKHPVHEPTRLLKDFESQHQWVCPVCGSHGDFDQINWRKSAGISTLFIEISSIFPKEAIPTEKLLDLLYIFSQCEWLWFYSRSSS